MSWQWVAQQIEAFEWIKRLMNEEEVLAHYHPARELVLTCDASPVEIGAALQQRGVNGVLRPIGFVSRSLTTAERNYAQTERKAWGLYSELRSPASTCWNENAHCLLIRSPW